MTSLFTQIVVDDGVLEYEPASSKSNALYHKRARTAGDEAGPKKPAFQVIHDLSRPRSQSLCLVQTAAAPALIAQPVETMIESPKIDSQWRLYRLYLVHGLFGSIWIVKWQSSNKSCILTSLM